MAAENPPKVALLILDGWGVNRPYEGNAITLAEPPTWNWLMENVPHVLLNASGEAVGLPEGQMGNSEVGHEGIGAGRVVDQILLRLNKVAENQSFLESSAIAETCNYVMGTGGILHVMGLISPGGVHSHEDHIFSLIRSSKASGVENIVVHAFTDGRDVLPQSCSESLARLAAVCEETGARIGSISGRFYSMDRNKNLDRTQAAYRTIKHAEGIRFSSPAEAIDYFYAQNITDEYFPPCVIAEKEEDISPIQEGDGVIFANFRTDRPRQLVEAFLEEGLEGIRFATMTRYSKEFPVLVAYDKPNICNTLGEVVEAQGRRQLKVTESEKGPHVTYFFRGQREEVFEGEEVIITPSFNVDTHAEIPEMKALEISQVITSAMLQGMHDLIIGNICNGDMVGHSGNVEAAMTAVRTVDLALELILFAASTHGYTLVVTADHGNCDEMIGTDGEKLTEHSTNPVPFLVVPPKGRVGFELVEQEEDFKLADIAPTVLRLLGIAQPLEMTGRSLIRIKII